LFLVPFGGGTAAWTVIELRTLTQGAALGYVALPLQGKLQIQIVPARLNLKRVRNPSPGFRGRSVNETSLRRRC